jgi:iron complex outermembrane receptor protein
MKSCGTAFLAASSMLALASGLGPAFAQGQPTQAPAVEAQADESKRDVIIVTAQKRAEDLQDVPISMTALGEEQLSTFAIGSSMEIARAVPNVRLDTFFGAGIPQVAIRGIANTDINATASSPVLFYYDNTVLENVITQGVPFFDLERVEVLRGPQGTLFGRNAAAGAILITTKGPSQTPEGYAKATVGNYNLRALEGAIGGGLTDTLSGRISFLTSSRDGQVYNTFLAKRELYDRYSAVRGQLLWEPSDQLSATFRTQYLNRQKDAFGFSSIDLPEPSSYRTFQLAQNYRNPSFTTAFKEISSDEDSPPNLESWISNIEVNYDAGPVTLKYVASYVNGRMEIGYDDDGTRFAITNEDNFHRSIETSHEFQVASATDGPFQWLAGAFLMDERSRNRQHADLTDLYTRILNLNPPGFYVVRNRTTDQTTESKAVFLHTTYDWTPQLRTTHAVRWTSDNREMINGLGRFALPLAVTEGPLDAVLRSGRLQFPAQQFIASDRRWEKVTWRLGADYQLTDDTMLYISASTGFRSGNFNGAVNNANQISAADPESVLSYEAGIKSDVIPGVLQVNLGAYRYDYKDRQIFALSILNGIFEQRLVNIPEAEASGLELEMLFHPTDSTDVRLAYGYQDSEITSFPTVPSFVGRPLPWSQKHSFSGSLSHAFDAFGGQLIPQVSASYRSKNQTLRDPAPEPAGELWLVNAQLAYETPGGIRVEAFVNNLFDEVEPLNRSLPRSGTAFGTDLVVINDRRMFGVSLSQRY